jgi:hypothetical protein
MHREPQHSLLERRVHVAADQVEALIRHRVHQKKPAFIESCTARGMGNGCADLFASPDQLQRFFQTRWHLIRVECRTRGVNIAWSADGLFRAGINEIDDLVRTLARQAEAGIANYNETVVATRSLCQQRHRLLGGS